MKTILISAILNIATTSALAATTDIADIESTSEYSKGKILAITERGPHAADAAHLLAIQNILHPAYKPQLMALENGPLREAEDVYHLTQTELPVFIFLNNDGKEIGRIATGSLTAVGKYVANNSAIIDQ